MCKNSPHSARVLLLFFLSLPDLPPFIFRICSSKSTSSSESWSLSLSLLSSSSCSLPPFFFFFDFCFFGSFCWYFVTIGSSSLTLINCKTKGLRVTIPVPLGKKSLPTMFSSTDDLPQDWDPTTAKMGKSISAN